MGNIEVGTNNSKIEETGFELEKLKPRLKALEERKDGMRKQNTRDTTRVRMKDVNVPILKSTDLKEYRRWKKSLFCWRECTQITLEMRVPHIIMNVITNAELNEVVITMERDEAQTKFGITKTFDMLDRYLNPHPFLKCAQT